MFDRNKSATVGCSTKLRKVFEILRNLIKSIQGEILWNQGAKSFTLPWDMYCIIHVHCQVLSSLLSSLMTHQCNFHYHHVDTGSLAPLWGPTSSWRSFRPLDFILRALRPQDTCRNTGSHCHHNDQSSKCLHY